MKNFFSNSAKYGVLTTAAVMSSNAFSQTAPVDPIATLTDGLAFDTILVGIAAVAGALSVIYVGRKGIFMVLDILKTRS